MLGLIGLAEVLPYFCVAPFAGYLVDQLPRRKLGMVACLGLVTTPLLLAAITMGWLGDGRGVGLIYASVAVTGMVRSTVFMWRKRQSWKLVSTSLRSEEHTSESQYLIRISYALF